MKIKLFTTAIATLLLIYACDEKYEPRVYEYEEYIPIESDFFAGDKNSSTYIDYEPDIELSIAYLDNGYFDYTQPFDLNGDGIDDFAIVVNGYKESNKPKSNFWRTLSISILNDYRISTDQIMVSDSGDNYYSYWSVSVVASLLYSDTITNYYSSGYYSSTSQLIETGYNYETNSWDTCCGLWNTWGEDRYIGFQRIAEDTTIGWIRMEMKTDRDVIILKDCAIQKYSNKKN